MAGGSGPYASLGRQSFRMALPADIDGRAVRVEMAADRRIGRRFSLSLAPLIV